MDPIGSGSRLSRSRRFPPIARPAIAAFLVVLVLAAAAVVEWRDRVQTLDAGYRIAATRVQLLEEQTARSFQAVDLMLVGIVDALRIAPSLRDHDPVFQATLRRKRDALPHVRGLFVIGADGYITQDTDHPFTPRVNLADRPYFQAHARNPKLGLHIAQPLVSRSLNRPFISMSRRIDAPDGAFAGIAVAAVEPRYFGTFYSELRLADRDTIALFLDDGTLIARNPHDDGVIGTSFAGSPLFEQVATTPAGTYESETSPVDRVPRVVGYRRVSDLPLVVLVGLDREALLAPWRMRALMTFTAISVIALLAGFLLLVITRHARQRAQAQQRLAAAERLETLGRMAGTIAHDFGNVLSAVVLSLHNARLVSEQPQLTGALDRALRAAHRGTQLASQLLGFARQQSLSIETVRANDVILELEELLRDAVGTGAEVELDLAPDIWPCRMDRAQFGIALLNLVINARQAMPDRPGHIQVATENLLVGEQGADDGLAPGEYVRVTVRDDGVGMPPEVARQATSPFFTTKPDGTGLGISQVYGFLKQVGGELRIASAVEAGTAVHLIFPRAPATG